MSSRSRSGSSGDSSTRKEYIAKVDDFVAGGDKYYPPDNKLSYIAGKDKKGRQVVQFDRRHLAAVGQRGRDQIRAALDMADKREGFIDKSRGMKLQRLRMAREAADEVDQRKADKLPDDSEPGMLFNIVNSFYKSDNLVRLTVFGLSAVFVVLLFRFMFYPLITM